MLSESLTEYQIHLFGGIIALIVLFTSVLGLLIYLDRRGVKTYSERPKKTKPRRARRREKKLLAAQSRKR